MEASIYIIGLHREYIGFSSGFSYLGPLLRDNNYVGIYDRTISESQRVKSLRFKLSDKEYLNPKPQTLEPNP